MAFGRAKIDGRHGNDFITAAKTNTLLESHPADAHIAG